MVAVYPTHPTHMTVPAVPLTATNLAAVQRHLQRYIREQAPIIACPSCRFERGLAALPIAGSSCALHRQCGPCIVCADAIGQERTHGPATTLCTAHRRPGAAQDIALTFCPHCYRAARYPFPDGFFAQPCRQHSNFDLVCPSCKGLRVEGGCRHCGDLAAIFFTPIEAAMYAFDMPFTQHTTGPTWLASLLRRTALTDEWDVEKWEEVFERLDALTKPTAPWWRDDFAQAAMRLALSHIGDALLENLPVCCVACYVEAGEELPASCRLQPCERHRGAR